MQRLRRSWSRRLGRTPPTRRRRPQPAPPAPPPRSAISSRGSPFRPSPATHPRDSSVRLMSRPHAFFRGRARDSRRGCPARFVRRADHARGLQPPRGRQIDCSAPRRARSLGCRRAVGGAGLPPVAPARYAPRGDTPLGGDIMTSESDIMMSPTAWSSGDAVAGRGGAAARRVAAQRPHGARSGDGRLPP